MASTSLPCAGGRKHKSSLYLFPRVARELRSLRSFSISRFSLRLFPSFVVKGILCPLRQSTPLESIVRGAKTHLIRATHTRRGGWAVSLYALLFQH